MPSTSQTISQYSTPVAKSAKLMGALAVACLLQLSLLQVSVTTAHAEPTVIVNSQDGATQLTQNPAADNDQEVEPDPQVAPAPSSPFNQNNTANPTNSNSTSDALPDALANPNSLASELHPNDADLSTANQELLSQNAQLQRDVNDLETRVNVLINERSGQLFMYGAVSVSIALFLGFMLGWFIFGRRDRW